MIKKNQYQTINDILTSNGSYIKQLKDPQEIPIIDDLNQYEIIKIDIKSDQENYLRSDAFHSREELRNIIKLLIYADHLQETNFNTMIQDHNLTEITGILNKYDLNLNLDLYDFMTHLQKLENIPYRISHLIDLDLLLREYDHNSYYKGWKLVNKNQPQHTLGRFIITSKDMEGMIHHLEYKI